jgi:tetratricopeptide (TPR) repeat protein
VRRLFFCWINGMTVRSGPEVSRRAFSAAQLAIAVAILLSVTLAAYHSSLNGALVFDDLSNIADNPSIRKLWPLGRVLSPPSEAGTSGRPIANLTYALNYAVHGLEVRGYHVVNVGLLALAALTLFGVVRRTLEQPLLRERFGDSAWLVALAAAGLWVVHPLTSSAVNYLSQRTEELAGLFYLLTLYCFIRAAADRESLAWPVLTVGACLLGMASKETMVTAPFIVWLYDRTFIAGTLRETWRRHGRLHLALAATWLVLAALMIGARLSTRGIGFNLGVSWFNYALTECSAVLHYLRLSFWPAPLVFDYGWKFERAIGPALPAVAMLGALLVAVGWALRRRPALGFLGAWFLVLLAPSSSVVPLTEQPIAESRVFLALAAVPVLVAAGGFLAWGRRGLIACVPLVLAGWATTVHRHHAYVTAASLWSDTVAKIPDNPRAHNNLGAALAREPGREQEAALHFETALRLRSDYADAHNNFGTQWQRIGRTAEALAHFEAALRINPEFADAHYNRGIALVAGGRRAEAIASFESALRLKPDDASAHNNLGSTLLDEGRVAEAIEHDTTAVRLDPNFADARYNLGNALFRAGRTPDAIAQFTEALRLQPAFAKAHNNLGTVLLQSGRVRDAIEHFDAALRIDPNYALARNNLAYATQILNGPPRQ